MQTSMLVLLVILTCSVISADAWRLRRASPSASPEPILMRPKSNEIRASSHSLPEKFYAGQLQKGSNCYQAYSKMTEFCAMASERDRSWLATLLANCHLEAANRKTIQWHPRHALRYASKEEYSLINRYIPLIADICSQTGHAHHLALFRMQFHNDKKLWETIEELEAAVNRAAEVNFESHRLTSMFESATASTLEKSQEVFKLIKDLRGATSSLESKHKELEQLHEMVSSTVQAYTEEKRELLGMLQNHSTQVKQQVEGINVRLRTQMEYNELLTNFTYLQEDMQRLREQEVARDSRHVREIHSFRAALKGIQISSAWRNLWLSAVRGLAWSTVSAPFRITRLLMILNRSEMLGRKAKLLVIGAQAGISFVSVLAVFKVLIVVKSLIDNWSEIVTFILGCFGLPGLKPLPRWTQKETKVKKGAGKSKDEICREKENIEKVLRKISSRIEKCLHSSVQRAVQELDINTLLSAKLEEIGQAYEHHLRSHIARVEELQNEKLERLRGTSLRPTPPLSNGKGSSASSSTNQGRRSTLRSSRRKNESS